eukprot:CAMPEP_0197028882 /NCGR_PEP_ID=MMETSP1384-20130603/8466_1 /TAXON_ID=29189 /ORGANISM="Ammonia sp." /LENGTH=161 /DNA_ID=CAMNT_0042457951 /DNA_START=114 /DNA_END=599 /DNA_ORIENTATION=-
MHDAFACDNHSLRSSTALGVVVERGLRLSTDAGLGGIVRADIRHPINVIVGEILLRRTGAIRRVKLVIIETETFHGGARAVDGDRSQRGWTGAISHIVAVIHDHCSGTGAVQHSRIDVHTILILVGVDFTLSGDHGLLEGYIITIAVGKIGTSWDNGTRGS